MTAHGTAKRLKRASAMRSACSTVRTGPSDHGDRRDRELSCRVAADHLGDQRSGSRGGYARHAPEASSPPLGSTGAFTDKSKLIAIGIIEVDAAPECQ